MEKFQHAQDVLGDSASCMGMTSFNRSHRERHMTQWTKTASVAAVQPTRSAIVGRAVYIKSEIEQIFRDCSIWNATHLNEPPINCDPDGKLQAIIDGIIKMLAAEPPTEE
jgi:hypothetical protein